MFFDRPAILKGLLPAILLTVSAHAQQTLGGLTGTVSDASGASISGAEVQLIGNGNGVSLTTTSKGKGEYQFQNLPVGTYSLVFTRDGFEAVRVPAVPVQENRTATINAALPVGNVATTINVEQVPLLDQTSAVNGYVVDARQIQETPLATGSFTRLATLTPGVSGELLSGIGSNAGLGNQPIWANGQRDTSNGFNVNGVDVTNLFNGKSSSEDSSQRYAFNIGQGAATGGQSQTNTSVYGSNGNGLATPPPEFVQELRVNAAQYDADQGNHSGAQIDVNTATGTNTTHGQGYDYRATNFANAAPFFDKQAVLYQLTLPSTFLVPQLHRNVAGGTLGGPVLKNKLFYFIGGQYEHDADALKGYSTLTVPYGLTDDRSMTGIIAAANSYNALSVAQKGQATALPTAIDPVALNLLQAKLADGTYLIPSSQRTAPADLTTGAATTSNVFLEQSALFRVFNGIGSLDYNVNTRDRLSAKYYYQHSPDFSPFTNANTEGYPATEDSGAQVGALVNTITIGSKINWEQHLGFSRQKVYSTFNSAFGNNNFSIGFPGSTGLPGLSLGHFGYSNGGAVTLGPNSTFANAGYFQNRLNPASSVILALGHHNISFGGTYNYTQLNVRNRRSNLGSASTGNFISFISGQVSSSNEITGNTNRYYRTNEGGAFVQDQWRVLPNLTLTAGLRYDYDGGFTEKYGNIFGFEPSLYSVTQSAVNNAGFVVAGNNAFDPSPGVSNSTLTGRQWGIGPRFGFAFTPKQNAGKIVFRGGVGIYYDRGQYFSYLSQPAGSSVGGPFGVTEAPPLVNYTLGAGTRTLENPLGSAVIPPSTSDPSTFNAKLVTANQIRTGCAGLTVETSNAGADCGVQPYNFGAYARNNKLPYAINYSFNVQVQLDNVTAMTIGYDGNVGRHLVIPVPFNEPGIATAGNPINGETSSYGYEVLNTGAPTVNGKYIPISKEPYDTYDGGNIDLRVPYVGYSPNAALFKAAGIASYNALQVHVDRRLAHGVSAGFSYTFAHALDEQSDIGLFFTGDNPNKLRDSYASADFDRTNTVVFNYTFKLPGLKSNSFVSHFTNGWQVVGLTTLQSGQPYSLYEYDGAVGSIYFGNFPTLANPILGIKDGSHPRTALTGSSGSQLANVKVTPATATTQATTSYSYLPAIDSTQLHVNNLQPGQKGVPLCNTNEPCDIFENDFTPGQRNIFRQAFQKDADVSFQKITRINERFSARYTFDVYNITNTTSLDIPNNSASVSASKLNGPSNASVAYGQVASSATTQTADYNKLYTIKPNGTTSFGAVRNAIGQPRTVEMSLHLNF